MENSQCFSGQLSDCMDLSGYSIKMIHHRQKMNTRLDEIYNREATPITKITVLTTGAKGEGTAKYFESDIDRLCTHGEMVCIDTNDVQTEKMAYVDKGLPKTIFISNPKGCFPGYTRLELLRLGNGNFENVIKASLDTEGDKMYLANNFPKLPGQFVMYDINAMLIDTYKRTGPSVSASNLDISYDYVYGILFDGRRFLVNWSKRPREHDWPTPDLIGKVLDTKGHVVPVASKNTKYLETEWRICYTEAELILLKSLNEYHIKVFILLKLVSKSFFHSITKEVSSYINKNVIFWMAEKNPFSSFTRDTLFERFIESLCFLRDRVLEGTLANYIIEERNLLEGRISKSQGKEIADLVNNFVSSESNWLHPLKIGSVFRSLQQIPEDLKERSKKRDQAEILLLRKNEVFKRVQCSLYGNENPNNETGVPEKLADDAEWNHLGENLHSLVVPEFRSLQDSGVKTFDIYKDTLMEMLS